MDSQDERKVIIVTQTTTITQMNFQAEVKDENCLWHLRFCHLNFGGLNLLHKKGMVKGFPLIEKLDRLCEGCTLGKQHRESFPPVKSIREKGTPSRLSIHIYVDQWKHHQ